MKFKIDSRGILMLKIIIALVFALASTWQLQAEDNKPIVIFLNGTSSAGKSSIADKLLEQLEEPFLKVGIDWYIGCLSPHFFEYGKHADQCYKFVTTKDDKGFVTTVEKGPVGSRLDLAAHKAMKVFLQQGFNLVIDEVLFDDESFQDYLSVFDEYRVYFIAIQPSIEAAELREIKRGDRVLGLARGLYHQTYSNKKYDLILDTTDITSQEAAKMVIDYMTLNPNPTAFQSNRF
jgi:chloramphenicol 3-O phosphotransferase